MRRVVPFLAVVVLAAACGNNQLGRSVPVCPSDDEFSSVTGAIIMQIQSVDSAEFVPCLNELNAGWSYEDLVPENGKSRFWLTSDRMGSRFAEITLTASCDVGSASQVGSTGSDGVTDYRSVEVTGSSATIVIVPVTGRETAYAQTIENSLEARPINDRSIFVITDAGDEPLADKVSAALGQGRPIIIVDEQDVAAETATLQMPGEAQSVRGLDFDDVFDRLDRLLPKPRFRGNWFKTFEGGCITYEFDAKGEGVDRLADDIEDAVGLYDAGELKRLLRSQGILG